MKERLVEERWVRREQKRRDVKRLVAVAQTDGDSELRWRRERENPFREIVEQSEVS